MIVVRGDGARDCARGTSCATRSPSINYMHPEPKLTVIDVSCMHVCLLNCDALSLAVRRSYSDSAACATRNSTNLPSGGRRHDALIGDIDNQVAICAWHRSLSVCGGRT
jgi:hypothetical protein